MKRVAVVTDPVGSGFYFPMWYNYYSRLFGGENIFLLVPIAASSDFSEFKLGGIERSSSFDNGERIVLIRKMIDDLLGRYDYVIRVDTDEFLVANPYKYASLSSYINSIDLPIVTARGYNLIPDRSDSDLDIGKTVLTAQRRLMYPYAALNKTALVSEKTTWLAGFHFCNHQPVFDDLLLIHLKNADLKLQVDIGREVARLASEEKFIEYHLTPEAVLRQRQNEYLTFDRVSSAEHLYRDAYIKEFLDTVEFHQTPDGGIYHGAIVPPERKLVVLDAKFDAIF